MTALEITSGQELEQFVPNTVLIDHTTYLILTGYEGTGKCFWCGGELKGKLKRYCRGHLKFYYRQFEWASARDWCVKRQEKKCANCGKYCGYKLEVHHILPLKGGMRFFSALNMPWNLVGLCKGCHWEIHRIMRPPRLRSPKLVSQEEARQQGQLVMPMP